MTAPSITAERPARNAGNRVHINRAKRLYAAARAIEMSTACDERCRETARAISLLALDLLAEARGA
jgi:hypothetical protein